MATLSSRLGRKTVELDHVSKAFGDHVVLRDFTYHIARDDRVGIVGRNGAGKSTLLNLIAGKLTPDSGTVDWGETVRIGYFSQEGRELDPRQRVYDFIHEVAGQVKTREGNFSATQMMERFLFPTQLQGQPIGKLSGGERRRLYLLSLLMEAPNILLLDEPTNDLDVTTLAILEEYLETFPGAVLAVSHRTGTFWIRWPTRSSRWGRKARSPGTAATTPTTWTSARPHPPPPRRRRRRRSLPASPPGKKS